jgi:HD superfamily phosphohydrolase
MHLMQKAVDVLRFKGVGISGRRNALYIAILLHDIGHGPSLTPWNAV